MDKPKALLPLTPVTFQILLSLTKGPMHGYGIRRDVSERTDGMVRLTAGTLYAGLKRMEEGGLISETEAPTELRGDAGQRWRFFELTGFGERVLEAEIRRMEADVEAARSLLPGPGRA